MSSQLQPNSIERTILRLFKRLSVCLMILGRRGSGKTDFSLLIMETLAKFEVTRHFASNVKIYKSTFPIEDITNLDDLTFWSRNNQGKKLFILDEAGKSIRRRTPMSSLNVKMLDNLQILRKYKLSIILIAPNEKYLDSATLGSDVLDAIVVKPYFQNPKVALYHDLFTEEQITYVDIPATSIKFDTWDIAPFKEHSATAKPKFKDTQLNILWEWSNGKTYKDLDIHPMKLNRLVRKYLRESLEIKVHSSHT